MRSHFSILSVALAAASAVFAALPTPASAGFVAVSRCNSAGGDSAPVLHIINGSDRFTVAIGENGLTRDIIFSEQAALAWAAASGLFPEGTSFGNYEDFICGLEEEDVRDEPEYTPEPEPEPEEEPEQEPEVSDELEQSVSPTENAE